MEIPKITWNNKVKINDNSAIPRENKVTDDDMNEVKNVVNVHADELMAVTKNVDRGWQFLGEFLVESNTNTYTIDNLEINNNEELEFLLEGAWAATGGVPWALGLRINNLTSNYYFSSIRSNNGIVNGIYGNGENHHRLGATAAGNVTHIRGLLSVKKHTNTWIAIDTKFSAQALGNVEIVSGNMGIGSANAIASITFFNLTNNNQEITAGTRIKLYKRSAI